jgi:hypothetical protein
MQVKSLNAKNAINAKAHRKEKNFMGEHIGLAVVDGEIKIVVNLRIYGTQARNTVCLWFHNEGWTISGSGSGSAGGYGYHRPSAAAEEAFKASGVELSQDINSRGDTAVRDAVLALTKHLYPGCAVEVIASHG